MITASEAKIITGLFPYFEIGKTYDGAQIRQIIKDYLKNGDILNRRIWRISKSAFEPYRAEEAPTADGSMVGRVEVAIGGGKGGENIYTTCVCSTNKADAIQQAQQIFNRYWEGR